MTALEGQRVLVTGGGGFLGSFLVEKLASRGAQVLAPRRAQYDLTRADQVERLFSQFRPQVVIHAAAVVGGIGANRAHPGRFFYENALMGIHTIEASRVYGAGKVVVLGTICAYPKFTPAPFREDDLWNGYPEETNAPYGVAKKALLVQCQGYRQEYGLNAIYLLPVNLYGPRDNFDLETSHVIPAMIRKFLEAREAGAPAVKLWGDGSPTREFLYVEDAAEGILAATESYDGPEPVNLGTGEEIQIAHLANTIAAAAGYEGETIWDASQPNGQPRRQLDVSRAQKEFGFRAPTRLAEGLRRTIEWYRAERASQRSAASR